MQFALISKRLPATRYFASYSAAKAHAKALEFTPRQYKIEEQTDREIPVTTEQYAELERALQWTEDRAKWDKRAKPTNLTEIGL